MKPGPLLGAWLKKAKPGCCPCGMPRAGRKDARLCADAKARGCRATYQRLYHLDHNGDHMKEVVAVLPDPTRTAGMMVVLACQHTELLSASIAARVGKRRKCLACIKNK